MSEYYVSERGFGVHVRDSLLKEMLLGRGALLYEMGGEWRRGLQGNAIDGLLGVSSVDMCPDKSAKVWRELMAAEG